MKKLVIAGAGGCIAAAVLMYVLVLPMLKGKPATNGIVAATGTPALEVGMLYALPERVLNLAPSGGAPHYARIELAIEFRRPKGVPPFHPKAAAPASVVPLDPGLAPVEAHNVQIEDAVVRIVGAKTIDALTNTDGKDALKRELLTAVGQIVREPEATAVYIVQLVAQ